MWAVADGGNQMPSGGEVSPVVTHSEEEDVQQVLQRQRKELAAPHAQLDTRGRRQQHVMLLRQIVAAVLVVIAALGVTLSVVGVWAGHTTHHGHTFLAHGFRSRHPG